MTVKGYGAIIRFSRLGLILYPYIGRMDGFGSLLKSNLRNGEKMEEKKIAGQKLADDQVEKASGGFQENFPGSYAEGEIIICPSCGNGDRGQFYADEDELGSLGKTVYRCAVCGQEFAAASGYGVTDVF